ncbi:MAG: hypothetical protein ACLFN5_01670 [bacterium]
MLFKSIFAGFFAGIIVFGINLVLGHVLLRELIMRSVIAAGGVGFAVAIALEATTILLENSKKEEQNRVAATSQKLEPELRPTDTSGSQFPGEAERELEKESEEHHEEGNAPDFKKDTSAGDSEEKSDFESGDAAQIADLISGSLEE